MFRSQSFITVLIAFVLLAFTFTPALAGSFPPGHNPPPGDTAPPDPAAFTPLPADPAAVAGIRVNTTAPLPNAPLNNNVYTTTPRFYFTPRANASQYHIVVVDSTASPDKIVYHFYGTGSCTDFICSMQPANRLIPVRYQAIKGGVYYWQVEAMVGGVWKGLSSEAYFAVLSKGFTSTFNENTSKWSPINGTWTRTTGGFYKAVGSFSTLSSAMQKEFFANDFVYEVKMKRKVESDSFNRIIFMGTPDPLAADANWDAGYYFGYYNSGHWGLWRRDGTSGTTYLYNVEPTTFISPYGWNTLTVWTDYPYIHMWINGAYLGYVLDDTYIGGYVGVGMFENDADLSPLLVDSAKLYYSAVSPYAITDAELGEPLNIQVDGEGK